MATEAQPQPSPAEKLYGLLKAKGYWDRSFNITFSLKAHEGKEKELLEAMNKVAPLTHKEPGVITYEFSQDLADPSYFVLYEQWKDGPGFQFHIEQAHTKEFLGLANQIAKTELHIYAPLKQE